MWIDTGFDGYLLLPAAIASELPISPSGLIALCTFADGRISDMAIGTLKVEWFGASNEVPVFLPDIEQPERMPNTGEIMGLIGISLLRNVRISMNLRSGGRITVRDD